jgi:hypothetical protein
MSAFAFNRNIQDRNYTSSVAIVIGGANTAAFDLEQIQGGDIEEVVFELVTPAVAGLSNSSTITYTLQDSADGTSFAAVDPGISTVQTGAGGVGAASKTVRFRLPVTTRRFVRIAQTNSSTPGTFSGSMVARLLF